ncbi:BEN domain-containing protein [Aphis craccivora]|uniref:BEN domain-containing protein n=1 Tax=Aphis craccivora TaxID=307492 RepID=A0A6G0Y1E5_APHCR|nr:BEN domain-containing protein [Aphis craccivora]
MVVNIKKINRKALFKKKDVLSNSSKSSIHIMKQIRNSKSQIPKSAMSKKRKRISSSIESNTRDLLDDIDDDDDDDENYSKSTKDELHNKIKVLNYENRKLRTQVSQQRAIIEASKSISDINKISNEILSSLNQSLSIIKTKKLNHDKTITTCQKQVKVNNKTSDIVKLPMVPSNSPTIHPKSGDSASHQPISTAVINFAETSATLPKFQILEDISINEHQINNNLMPGHDFGQNDLYDFCVSAAAAMDKPTAALINTLQSLPSELPLQKEHFQISGDNCSGQLMEILVPDLPITDHHSDDNNLENLVELWPRSGVRVNPNKLALVNRKSFAKLVGDLMLIVFCETDLRTGSISGKKCNFKKSNESPKKKLNETKTCAILECMFQ